MKKNRTSYGGARLREGSEARVPHHFGEVAAAYAVHVVAAHAKGACREVGGGGRVVAAHPLGQAAHAAHAAAAGVGGQPCAGRALGRRPRAPGTVTEIAFHIESGGRRPGVGRKAHLSGLQGGHPGSGGSVDGSVEGSAEGSAVASLGGGCGWGSHSRPGAAGTGAEADSGYSGDSGGAEATATASSSTATDRSICRPSASAGAEREARAGQGWPGFANRPHEPS